MQKSLTTALFVILISSSLFAQKLTLLWESDTLFLKPESALFDEHNNVIYISNVNGDYLAKDSNGFISVIDTEGKILALEWCVGGLDNPQGLGLVGTKLYVADIDRIVEIDTKSGEINARYPIEGATFLNDITTDGDGNVYVSDCFGKRIYRLRGGNVELFSDDARLAMPNGLLSIADTLFGVSMETKTLFAIDKKSGRFSQRCAAPENADGIVSDGNGGFFVSGAWQSEIYHIDSKGRSTLVLKMEDKDVLCADIWYIADRRMLIVPTLYKTVRAYRWE